MQLGRADLCQNSSTLYGFTSPDVGYRVSTDGTPGLSLGKHHIHTPPLLQCESQPGDPSQSTEMDGSPYNQGAEEDFFMLITSPHPSPEALPKEEFSPQLILILEPSAETCPERVPRTAMDCPQAHPTPQAHQQQCHGHGQSSRRTKPARGDSWAAAQAIGTRFHREISNTKSPSS